MGHKMRQASRKPLLLLQLVLLVIVAASKLIGCSALERHDEVAASPPAPNSEMNCPCSPCGCPVSPLPPPPPPTHPTSDCPPPPPPTYLYMEGPPSENSYPFAPYFHISGGPRSCTALLPVYVMCGLFALWEFWLL